MTYDDLITKVWPLNTKANRAAYEATQDKYLFAVDTIRQELDMKLSLNSDLTDDLADALMFIWER